MRERAVDVIMTTERSTSVRKKAIIGGVVALSNFAGLIIYLLVYDQSISLFPFSQPLLYETASVLTIAIACAYVLALRCPNCRRRAFGRQFRAFETELDTLGGLVPKRCSSCGRPL